jgi:hypothetical protein
VIEALAAALILVGFGDSMTDEWWQAPDSHNASYVLRAEVPDGWQRIEYGKISAACRHVLDRPFSDETFRLRIGDFGPGDVVVLMCWAGIWDGTGNVQDPDDIQANVDAILEMEALARAQGVHFIFATHPAWYIESPGDTPANPFSRAFYDLVIPQLHPDTVVIDNDLYWSQFGWNLWPWLYSDTVHMSEGGALLLGRTLTQAMREMCLWLPLYPYPWCED